MYCKFCGSRIASDTTKCVSCGADIDFNDGGQSFFDDNELDAWKNNGVSGRVPTSVPKTEMREPLSLREESLKKEDGGRFVPQTSADTKAVRSQTRSKKKSMMDYFSLSSANKLIIFCIASALAIVLLAVAIIAVLNSGGDESDTDALQTSYGTSVDDELTDGSDADTGSVGTENDNNKGEIENIKILMNNQEISHPVSAYIVEDKIYISIDRILKAEGYKTGVKTEDNENRIRYDHNKNSKAVEIEKGTDEIWIRENSEDVDVDTQYLDGKNFNVGTDTYVEAKSFLNKIGYSKVEYDRESNTLTVER